MNNEEFFSSLSEEVKKKLAECKTKEELRKVLDEAGIEPLGDELLDAVAGAGPFCRRWYTCPYRA